MGLDELWEQEQVEQERLYSQVKENFIEVPYSDEAIAIAKKADFYTTFLALRKPSSLLKKLVEHRDYQVKDKDGHYWLFYFTTNSVRDTLFVTLWAYGRDFKVKVQGDDVYYEEDGGSAYVYPSDTIRGINKLLMEPTKAMEDKVGFQICEQENDFEIYWLSSKAVATIPIKVFERMYEALVESDKRYFTRKVSEATKGLGKRLTEPVPSDSGAKLYFNRLLSKYGVSQKDLSNFSGESYYQDALNKFVEKSKYDIWGTISAIDNL